MPVRPRYYGAIDLGGTKILSLVADADGNVCGQDLRPTLAHEGPDAVQERMIDSLDAAIAVAGLERGDLAAVGVASPGTIDVGRGVVAGAGQLPGWRNVPLQDLMTERLGLPVVLENDATAAALGEHAFGAGRGSRHMIYLTVSTGVGGGIIIDGELYRGKSGAAGELGHIVIGDPDLHPPDLPPPYLETFASGTAIARRGQELLGKKGEAPVLDGLAKAEGTVTAEMMHRAALAGDEGCKRAFQEAGRYLGMALAGYVNIFNPEVIVIGGGVAQAGALLLEPARQQMERLAMERPRRDVRLSLSGLGQQVGALGMVAVLRKQG